MWAKVSAFWHRERLARRIDPISDIGVDLAATRLGQP